MMRTGVAALVCIASLSAADVARACVDLRFDMAGITSASIAREMVREATSIEVMRVTSWHVAPKPDPLYLEYYEPPRLYQLEVVETLLGDSRGSFEVAGFEDGWLEREVGSSPLARNLNTQPLWWLTPEGYGELYKTVILDPRDQGSVACASPITLTEGAEFLAFRDENGELLGRDARGPVLERLHGEDDPWLLEVRRAIAAAQPRGSRSPSWFDWLFAAVYGSRLTPAKTH